MLRCVPRGWQWDETLYRGSATYYRRGRLPYPSRLADACATALGLDGHGRLIDVGCGPGIIALLLAHWFDEVVGVDPDADMLAEAARAAQTQGAANVRWVHARAEDLPPSLGPFRVATFAQSFHWMDRERVTALMFEMLEPGGAFVQISGSTESALPVGAALQTLVARYLGPERRAGQGVLRFGTPSDESAVLRAAGFGEPQILNVPGGEIVERSVDDMVAAVFANSARAPHLFGDRLEAFEAEVRSALWHASPSGAFAEQIGDTELRIWRTPV